MRLLVVEDEKKVSSFSLEEESVAVEVASDGETGLQMALDWVHDLIILDIQLPEMDGLSVVHGLRREKT
jgi:two-component system, OmpR family, copper resistance phosphate regulon response regulator CusR